MSEVKRYLWSFGEKFGLGLFISNKGDYVKYEDYAEEKHRADQNAAYLELLTERMLAAEKQRDKLLEKLNRLTGGEVT